MVDLGFRLILGQLAADYLLQPKKMALQKSAPGSSGAAWCFLHSVIYALMLGVASGDWKWPALVCFLVSHYAVDRWSLAQKWLDLIGGRNFLAAYERKGAHWEIDVAFSSLVYAVADNTLHLFLSYLIVKVL
jgi:hypothetical protein